MLPDDPHFTIAAVSDAYLQAAKQSRQIVGRSVMDVFPDTHRELIASFHRVFASDGAVQFLVHRLEDVNELRASEMLFSRAFEKAPIGMVLTTPEGQIMEMNRAYLDMLGYTREELAARDSRHFTHPDDVAPTRRFYASFQDGTHTMATIEKRYIHKDGRIVWARASSSMHREKGRPAQLIAIIEDITERKRVEAALREQLRLTEAITTNASVALFIMDNRHQCIFMNPAAETLTGFTFEEIQGRALHSVIHFQRADGSFYPLEECPLCRVLHENNQVHGEEVFIHKEGHFYPVAYAASPIREGAGVIGTVIELLDIGGRKRMESDLRASKERLQQVFAQAPVAIIVLRGRDFVVELANPPYQALLQGRNLLGRRFAESVPELGQHVWDALNHVMDTGEPFLASEWSISYDSDKDGEIEDHWFNLVYSPIREPDSSVSGVIAVLTEVTPQVLARRELETVNRELEEFAYVASHDLQEPLRNVSIYSELLSRTYSHALDDRAVEFLAFINEGSARMESLIRDLLSYSRIVHKDGLPAGVADLSLSLAQARYALEKRIEETGAVITAQPLPKVQGDTSQMAQVFQNLLSNALKYRKPEVPPEVHISANLEGGQWLISVQDNGIGFDPQYAERIFGLFKRLHKDEYPGTGLGLAICKRIVERYRGRMWAEGRLGEGSTIYMALPE